MRKRSIEDIVNEIVRILQKNPRIRETRHSGNPLFKKYTQLREELKERDKEAYETEPYLADVGYY